ncbi:hypothetical protein Btru_040816 [Bulinus truncatus]|nr:hypothetical protein Btru_040816 [Bulinus truncatus]
MKQSQSAAPPHQVFFTVQSSSVFLFKDWHICSTQDYAIALVVVCLLTIVYEVIQGLLRLAEWTKDRTRRSSITLFLLSHVVPSVLHLLRVGFGYILMISVMTFNVWMLLTVTLAAGFGYFIAHPVIVTLYLKINEKKRKRLLKHLKAPHLSSPGLAETHILADISIKGLSRELNCGAPLLKQSNTSNPRLTGETVLC